VREDAQRLVREATGGGGLGEPGGSPRPNLWVLTGASRRASSSRAPFFRDRLSPRAAEIAAWAEENKRETSRFPLTPLPS